MFAHQEGEMEWVTVRVVGPRQEGVDQGAEHTLDNLTNSATYEAIVQVGQWGTHCQTGCIANGNYFT